MIGNFALTSLFKNACQSLTWFISLFLESCFKYFVKGEHSFSLLSKGEIYFFIFVEVGVTILLSLLEIIGEVLL